MKIYNISWDNNKKSYYYYESDFSSSDIEIYDKIKKNEPIKKFNRWFDKFNLIQTEEVDKCVIKLICDNFINKENITPDEIKTILKIYKLNKYYKLIPSIYCNIFNTKFFISDEIKLNIKSLFNKFILQYDDQNITINYNFFIKSLLLFYNNNILANSIPCINSLDRKYEYILNWNNFKQLNLSN